MPETSAEAMLNLLLLADSSPKDICAGEQDQGATAPPESALDPDSISFALPEIMTTAVQQSSPQTDCQTSAEPAQSSETQHQTVAGRHDFLSTVGIDIASHLLMHAQSEHVGHLTVAFMDFVV